MFVVSEWMSVFAYKTQHKNKIDLVFPNILYIKCKNFLFEDTKAGK